MAVEPNYEQENKDFIAGKRVNEFLLDPHVKKSIADRQAKLAKLIFRAKTPDEALDLWYVGRALEESLDALKLTADKAEKVEADRTERERVAIRQRRPSGN